MSVFISNFKNLDGSWTVVHDDAPGGWHTGSIQPTAVTFQQNMDGSPSYQYLSVPCPVCGAVTTHPVGGGAQPASVQEMFIRNAASNGCPCSAHFPRGRAFGLVRAHIKAHTEGMDFPGRFSVPSSITS